MKEITLNMLYDMIQEEIKKGHGDKLVIVSDDDELNGVHAPYHGFITEGFDQYVLLC